MNGQARRSLVLCVATFLATLPGEPSQSQTTTAPAAENVQTELPPQAKRWLNIQLRNEARAKKIGAPYYDPFPIVVCNGACGAINRDGTVAVPFAYDRVDQFSEGRALVRVRHRYSYLYGYVDDTGRVIATPQYTIGDYFRHGFAQIDVEGKSGLIDREGQVALWPQFGFVVPFTKDAFWATEERSISPGSTGTERFYQRRDRHRHHGKRQVGPR